MSDQPLQPDEPSIPSHLSTTTDATIYLQHIVREFLLDNVQAWRGMAGAPEATDEDRRELNLIIGQAELLAKSLKMANVALGASQAVVVPLDTPLIQVPGSRLPAGGRR